MDIFGAFITLNGRLASFDVGVDQFEGEAVGFFAGFTAAAIAGNAGVVVELIAEAVVDFGEFMVDDGEEVAGARATDANLDFVADLGFEDFGAVVGSAQDDAGSPDEGLVGAGDVFDVFVHLDDEAAEEALGHDAFVFVA